MGAAVHEELKRNAKLRAAFGDYIIKPDITLISQIALTEQKRQFPQILKNEGKHGVSIFGGIPAIGLRRARK